MVRAGPALTGSSPLARGLRQLGGLDVDGSRIIPARAGFTWRTRSARTRGPDHPRSRGVYKSTVLNIVQQLGSSPLARGLLVEHLSSGPHVGIIPARAGFTSRTRARTTSCSDHPRSRGVYDFRDLVGFREAGSSPLARGLPGGRPLAAAPRSDHPRSRGVYALLKAGAYTGNGSSPLARGLHGSVFPYPWPGRIIPARAGFTYRRMSLPFYRRDHPRSRGVYHLTSKRENAVAGSSPLARGLRAVEEDDGEQARIIPARAGFTLRRHAQGRHGPDHPRSRGVYAAQVGSVGLIVGSSPLARGLLLVLPEAGLGGGIIPARAGFTLGRLASPMTTRDHPRSRGVYGTGWRIVNMDTGSSPLARGLRPAQRLELGARRIIPARAGFTRERGTR